MSDTISLAAPFRKLHLNHYSRPIKADALEGRYRAHNDIGAGRAVA
jgi:hypothetical protein